VVKEIRGKHPTADMLIATARDDLAGLRSFVLDHHIATMPSDLLPEVEETPGFRRATTSAALDPPGPLEQRAMQAFYYVTPPDAGLAPDKLEQYLEGYYFSGLGRKPALCWPERRRVCQAVTRFPACRPGKIAALRPGPRHHHGHASRAANPIEKVRSFVADGPDILRSLSSDNHR